MPPSQAVPLVLQLHGRGIGPLAFDRWTRFTALANAEGFAVALPSAVGEIWNDGRFTGTPIDAIDDVGYLTAVLDDVATRLSMDVRRVYVVGMSNGATMAGRLACERAARFAAVAQVAGTADMRVAERCHGMFPVPILNIHGTADQFAPFAGGSARGLRARLLIRRRAAPAVGVDAWAARWVKTNGAAAEPAVERIAPDVTVRHWAGETRASDVVFYRIDGGGHTWPGAAAWVGPFLGRTSRTIDATRVIWDFFAAHSKSPDHEPIGA